jgi:hypothetical protein
MGSIGAILSSDDGSEEWHDASEVLWEGWGRWGRIWSNVEIFVGGPMIPRYQWRILNDSPAQSIKWTRWFCRSSACAFKRISASAFVGACLGLPPKPLLYFRRIGLTVLRIIGIICFVAALLIYLRVFFVCFCRSIACLVNQSSLYYSRNSCIFRRILCLLHGRASRLLSPVSPTSGIANAHLLTKNLCFCHIDLMDLAIKDLICFVASYQPWRESKKRHWRRTIISSVCRLNANKLDGKNCSILRMLQSLSLSSRFLSELHQKLMGTPTYFGPILVGNYIK